MTTHFGKQLPQFYITAPQPCPYLDGRYEKKIFTHLLSDGAEGLNEALTHAGFRRSQNITYKPACDGCTACVSVRIRANEAVPGRNQRRILKRNEDLDPRVKGPRATGEQFSLLKRYLKARHASGGMADMGFHDYLAMVEDTPVTTRIVEYRDGSSPEAPLTAVALTDVLSDGLSMVYSFYDPAAPQRSLGTFMILDHIERARLLKLPYVYLGYWVEGCGKMSYKIRFRPMEALGPQGWVDIETLPGRAWED